MVQWNATLGGAGYVLPADAAYQSAVMTGPGRVAAAGRFVAAKVLAVSGGTAPAIQIRHGKDPSANQIRSVAATGGATIDQRATPDACPGGIYLTVSGNPLRIEVEILWL